jgi:hypothetical protein
MNLKVLFLAMKKKNFHYFNGNTIKNNGDLCLTFSTLSLGKGDSVDIIIGDKDNVIENCWIDGKLVALQVIGVSDPELLQIIEKHL